MLINIKKKEVVVNDLTELQKADFNLPQEQVTKFAKFQHLIETELENEVREPDMENAMRDLFDALHNRNTIKLLRVLQGNKKEDILRF